MDIEKVEETRTYTTYKYNGLTYSDLRWAEEAKEWNELDRDGRVGKILSGLVKDLNRNTNSAASGTNTIKYLVGLGCVEQRDASRQAATQALIKIAELYED